MATRVNYTDFYRSFAKKHEITQAQSDNLCSAVFIHLKEYLDEFDNVSIYHLGTFKKKKVKAHETVNPNTMRRIMIPEKESIFFKIAKTKEDKKEEE